MKKLSKIKLNDAAIMSDGEMKYIFGGTGVDTGSSTTGFVICSKDGNEEKCADTTSKCKVPDTALEGTCEWRSYTGDVGSLSMCNCVNHP